MDKCHKCLMPSNHLIRQNPKGEKGIFFCVSCNEKEVHPEVTEICDIIKKG